MKHSRGAPAAVSVLAATLLLSVSSTSCATRALWKATDPDAVVQIPAGEASEDELRSKGAPYVVDSRGTYHVGKTGAQRLGDHALRFALTPATVFVDVSPYLALVFLGYLGGDVRADGSMQPILLPWNEEGTHALAPDLSVNSTSAR